MRELRVIPLSSYVRAYGEEGARARLAGFSCAGLSSEVEEYLHGQAFRHSLKRTSITYLVFADGNDAECLAYYTLAIKPFAISFSRLTARQKDAMKDMARVSISSERKSYGISSYLIAQLAKNFSIRGGKGVSGKALVSFILNQIRGVREQVGGKVVFLEYEKGNAKLREFYRLCGFEEFKIPSDSEDSGQLGQMFCFLNDEPPIGGPGS